MNQKAIETLLQEDEKAWRELCTVLDAHPDVNLHNPASKPWNSRDVYAHMARWLEYNAAKVKAVTENKPIPIIGESVEEVNNRWEEEDASLSLEEARRRAQNAYKIRKNVLKSIPSSAWSIEVIELAHIDGVVISGNIFLTLP